MSTQVLDVNTTDLLDAIRLGCQSMGNQIDPRQNTCYFHADVDPELRFAFNSSYSDAHVPGRHLNALLNAEAVTGPPVAEDWVEHLRQVTYISYSGPLPFPLNRESLEAQPLRLDAHNFREGFHALYALAAFRRDERAYELAEKSIRSILELWSPDTNWNRDRLEGEFGLTFECPPFIIGLARAIGPLVKLHRATGCAAALELALVLKDKAIGESYLSDGGYNAETFGPHTHSTTCVLSSLAQLADWTRDASLMERVKAFYDNGLWQIRDKIGWSIENAAQHASPDRGEGNNTADIVETALILGKWGHTEYYGDAERIVRSHLLPSQLRDVSFTQPTPGHEGEDSYRDVAERLRGSWGFPAPYGHYPFDTEWASFNTDIVGGVVGGLCEVVRSAVESNENGQRVNLLFSGTWNGVMVESPYEKGREEKLCIRVEKPGPLWVRLPDWMDGKIPEVHGTDEKPLLANGYLLLSKPPVGTWLEFEWPLKRYDLELQHRSHAIPTRMRGDEVEAMESFGTRHTFFAPIIS